MLRFPPRAVMGLAAALLLPFAAGPVAAQQSGGIPVPIYPPARPAQIEEHVRRHTGILENAEASILVTVPQAMTVARLLEAGVPGLRRVVTVAGLTQGVARAAT